MLLRFLKCFADLPLTIVATSSPLAGLVLGPTEAAGWNEWGHEGLLAAVGPIAAWVGAAVVEGEPMSSSAGRTGLAAGYDTYSAHPLYSRSVSGDEVVRLGQFSAPDLVDVRLVVFRGYLKPGPNKPGTRIALCANRNLETAMTRVTGLFKDKNSAERAFQSVIDLNYDKSDVNVVISDEVHQRWVAAYDPSTARPATTDMEKQAAADGGASASSSLGGPTGGTVGTLAPLVAAVGVLLIPGFGIVAGPLAIALAAAATTGVAMGVIGILTNWGIPEDRIERYEAAIRAGGILLGVEAHSDADAVQIQQRWQECGGEHVHS